MLNLGTIVDCKQCCGSALVSILLHIRNRIQRLGPMRIRTPGFGDQSCKILWMEKRTNFFNIKNCNLLSQDLQEGCSTYRRSPNHSKEII